MCLILRLRAELDSVLGTRNEIKYDDLKELKYLSCVFKETLRLYTPVAGFSRQTKGKFNINGFDIPDGTFIQVSVMT
jgi:cytochrome P450